MTREEAIKELEEIAEMTVWNYRRLATTMAIEALRADIVRCEDCKYQDECEEVVLFDINDDEVMGHRVHWCSYGRSK